MADPRFHDRKGPFSLGELAARTGADLADGADPARCLVDVAPLETAGPDDLSFLDNKNYADAFAASKAGGCMVHPDFVARAPEGMALLVTEKPYRAYALAAQAFYPSVNPPSGISPDASVADDARIGEGCCIEAGAVVQAKADIGAGCWIGSNAVIGRGVVVGAQSRVGANASIFNSLIGERCQIYPGARLGQDGFGFAPDPTEHLKIPQLGRVVVGDDVEIGANTTIDRGAGPDTIIGDRCMIDNLVQIAHNVELGAGCVIVALVGISGSAKLADYVFIGGQAGVAGHLKIGAGVRIAAQSGVIRNIEPGVTVGGSPALPAREWHRQTVTLSRLARTGDKK
jgi:UDP-3-O-[3-hydroxymyristoyl] glucosamine N-acyltransferase